MPSLLTSSQFRRASVVAAEHHSSARLASTMTNRHFPTNVGLGNQRNVGDTKVVMAKLPLARLGLPPPPRLANILQVATTSTKPQAQTITVKKRKESWESNCENKNTAVHDPSTTVCFTGSYVTFTKNDESTTTTKRVCRTTSNNKARNAAWVVEVRPEPHETRRLMEAAMALSSISQRNGPSLVPAVAIEPSRRSVQRPCGRLCLLQFLTFCHVRRQQYRNVNIFFAFFSYFYILFLAEYKLL